MLALALLLDGLIGEPKSLWTRVKHPIVLIGDLIEWLENRFNNGQFRREKGLMCLLSLLFVFLPIPILIAAFEFAWPLEVIGAAVLLAHRSLIDHVQAVETGLAQGIDEGRRAVSMIVGRDPDMLDEAGVSRAAIESAAENFSDGVVAPAFWFAIGGLPGIVFYKVVNTADSMIGHRTERFRNYGWAAARLDDILNWVPARLTGVLFCVTSGGRAAFDIMRRDAPKHRSPNAGWPEAAMAASLDIALAGPRIYAGASPVDDPFINSEGHLARPTDIGRAIGLLWRTWAVVLVIAVGVAFI